MNTKTPEELMLIYKNNSPDEAVLAFNELYGRFSQRVYNYLNSKTKNPALSDDLLQKVFIKVHESKHLYDPKYKFEQWIFVIARTSTLDSFRSEKRYEERLKKYESPDVQLPPSEDLDSYNLETMDGLKDLEAHEIELLEMKYVDDLSYSEISKVLGKSETSLRKSVSRMMARMRG